MGLHETTRRAAFDGGCLPSVTIGKRADQPVPKDFLQDPIRHARRTRLPVFHEMIRIHPEVTHKEQTN